MPWTRYELGSDCMYNGNTPIKVPLQLSYSDIQDIVDMTNWSWENDWMHNNISETVCTELLQNHLPHLYNKVQQIAHEIFCTNYPNSEHIEGFGIYEIFCPDEIVEFAAFSQKTYYLK